MEHVMQDPQYCDPGREWEPFNTIWFIPQVLVLRSIYQGKPFGVPIFDPQPTKHGPNLEEQKVKGRL